MYKNLDEWTADNPELGLSTWPDLKSEYCCVWFGHDAVAVYESEVDLLSNSRSQVLEALLRDAQTNRQLAVETLQRTVADESALEKKLQELNNAQAAEESP